MIHNWLAEDIHFRKAYHEARCESETASLEPLRQLAHKSVRAAIYLAERQRKLARCGPRRRLDEPIEEILARIDSTLRTMFDDSAKTIMSIEDTGLRERVIQEMRLSTAPVLQLFTELWKRFEVT
jgi:hypothetical protein